MNNFKADLHIHSVLSPCASLEMSPSKIVAKAKAKGINILGLTDHNSTRHCKVMSELGKEEDIFILPGIELNTKEEIHCLAFFENIEKTELFQEFVEKHKSAIKNNSRLFGNQLIVDKDENIIDEVEWLLISALDVTIDRIEEEVHRLNGLFIPAHVDRNSYSILSVLGFIPDHLHADALEVSGNSNPDSYRQADYNLICGSDAHDLKDIGRWYTELKLNKLSFDEIKGVITSKEKSKIKICINK